MIQNPIYESSVEFKALHKIQLRTERYYILVDGPIEPIQLNSLSEYMDLKAEEKEKLSEYKWIIADYFQCSRKPLNILSTKDLKQLHIIRGENPGDYIVCALYRDNELIQRLVNSNIEVLPLERP